MARACTASCWWHFRMQGLLIFDFADRLDEARNALAGWVRAGKRGARISCKGQTAPGAIEMLYKGENTGKLLVPSDASPSRVEAAWDKQFENRFAEGTENPRRAKGDSDENDPAPHQPYRRKRRTTGPVLP